MLSQVAYQGTGAVNFHDQDMIMLIVYIYRVDMALTC
jgi:hypothetical protein